MYQCMVILEHSWDFRIGLCKICKNHIIIPASDKQKRRRYSSRWFTNKAAPLHARASCCQLPASPCHGLRCSSPRYCSFAPYEHQTAGGLKPDCGPTSKWSFASPLSFSGRRLFLLC